MARFKISKLSSGCASGLFLMVLPLCINVIRPSLAQAQPAPQSATKKSPLTAEQRATFDQIMMIARVQGACATMIDLKMQNATLDDVVARIKPILQSKNVSLEVRGAKPIRVSFGLKDSSIGKVLTPVAALAGCKFYVLGSGLLISPPAQLTEAEKHDFAEGHGGEWARNMNAVPHDGWTLTIGSTPPLSKQRAVDFCASRLDFKFKDATLDNVVEYIKGNLPEQSVPVQIRGASPIRASFASQGTTVGGVLTPLAALAGCKVYILSSGVLIAPSIQLTKEENLELKQNQAGVWEDNVDVGEFINDSSVADGMKSHSWSIQKEARKLFCSVIAQEATGSTTNPTSSAKMTFGNFSPDSQAMLQQMANWAVENAHTASPGVPFLHLGPGSPISISSSPEAIQISFSGVDSDAGSTKIAMTTFLK